jgi:ATP-dependent Clp protease adapter protein ClpS
MSTGPADFSKQRFIVSIYEIREEIVFAEEFSGRYTRSVTLSDGTTRTIELTPMLRDGQPVVELKDTGGQQHIGVMRVLTGAQTNGKLMVRVLGRDDFEATSVQARSQLPESPVLPPGTPLTSIADFVPPGFTQGIEILNDNSTPMEFVVNALSLHAGLTREDSNKTMFAIHTRGGALIPTHSLEDAERIAAQITADAAERGYPLVCRAAGFAP